MTNGVILMRMIEASGIDMMITTGGHGQVTKRILGLIIMDKIPIFQVIILKDSQIN